MKLFKKAIVGILGTVFSFLSIGSVDAATPEGCFTFFDTSVRVDGQIFEGVEIRSYSDTCGPVVEIPSTLSGKTVLSISNSAFYNKGLTSVTIPNTVSIIGGYAFQTNQLTSVNIPNSVTVIGISAFINNQLTSVNISNSLIKIEGNTFARNKLTSVIIPNSVTSIGYSAFADNQLKSVTIPNSVTSIGSQAFANNQLETAIIPDSVTTLGEGAFQNNELTHANIPNNIYLLEDKVFENNKITTIDIGANVNTIGNYAFANNSLTGVTLTNTIVGIGNSAFANNSIEKMTFTNYVTNIGKEAFANNKITNINFTEALYSLGAGAFSGNLLTSIRLPNRLTYIADDVFRNNKLTNVVFGNAVTSIGNRSFMNNEFTSFSAPSTVTSIGDSAYENNKLASITLHNNITNIGSGAFKTNLLKTVSIPTNTNLNILNNSVFENNLLTSVTIPSNIKTLGNAVFRNNKLTSATIPSTVTSMGAYVFADNQITSTSIGNGITSLGTGVYENNKLATINIPSNITSIGRSTFSGNLFKNITIPNSVTTIGQYAFYNNELTKVTLPNALTNIDQYTFANNSLTGVYIPRTLTGVQNYAFYNNSGTVSLMCNGFSLNPYVSGRSYSTLDNSCKLKITPVTVGSGILYLSTNNGSSYFGTGEVYNSSGSYTRYRLSPNTGHQIKKVTLIGVTQNGVTNPVFTGITAGSSYSFVTPDNNVTVKAEFEPIIYSISKNTPTGGTLTVVSTGYYQQQITVKAVPNAKYELKTLTVNGGASLDQAVDPDRNTYTFTMPANNVTINATFGLKTYNITVNSASYGSVTASPNRTSSGETVTLSVNPNTGARLKSLTFNPSNITYTPALSDGTYTYRFTMPEKDVSITPIFEMIDYTITLNQANFGTMSVNRTSANYGNSITLTVTANTGYSINSISGLSGINYTTTQVNTWTTRYTFTMPNKNLSITPSFSQVRYTITKDPTENGSITVDTYGYYEQEKTITVNPAAGYKLSKLQISGSSLNPAFNANDPQRQYKFTMGTSDVVIHAEFELIKYFITTEHNEGGQIFTIPTEGYIGQEIIVVIIPKDGYEIDGALTASGGVNLRQTAPYAYSFKIGTNNVVVKAKFKESETIYDPDDEPGTTPSKCFDFDEVTFTIKDYYLNKYEKCTKDVIIPSTIHGVKVENIGNQAFLNKSLVSVIIPNSVKNIGEDAFKDNSLKTINIPNVLTIGTGAFKNNQISNLTLGNGLVKLGNEAFFMNSLTSVTIPNTITSIGYATFSKNRLQTVNLGNNTKTIGAMAFEQNNISSIKIPQTLESVSSFAFSNNNNNSIVNLYCEGYSSNATIENNSYSELDSSCKQTYTITVNTVTGGTISPSKTGATNGETITLTVTKEAGYKLTSIVTFPADIIEETINDTTDTYTFTMPNSNVSITPTFTKETYNIKVTSNSGGSVGLSKTSAYSGETVTLTVSPEAGYEVKDIVGVDFVEAITPERTSYSFVVQGSTNIRVTFGEKKYNVTVKTTQNGKFNVIPTSGVKGDIVTVVSQPNSGYKIKTLTASGSDGGIIESITDNNSIYTFRMGTSNVEVSGTFEKIPDPIIEYNINVNSPQNGELLLSKIKAQSGETVVLTVKANTGYVIKNLYIIGSDFDQPNISPNINEYTFKVINTDVTIIGEFDAQTYNIKINNTDNGYFTTIPADKGASGQIVTIFAYPDENYQLKSINISGAYFDSGSVKPNKETYTFIMPANDVTINGSFESVPEDVYNITVYSSVGGAVTPSTNQAHSGDTITLTVSTVDGYELKSLSGVTVNEVINASTTEYTFEMPNNNVIITPTFEKNAYTITKNEPENGTLILSKNSANYGDLVSLTVKANSGYMLKDLTISGARFNQQVNKNTEDYTFVVQNSNVAITGSFELINYSISLITTGSGTATLSKTGAKFGETITLTITPDTGNRVKDVRISGAEFTEKILPTYKFSVGESDIVVYVDFEEIDYSISVIPNLYGIVQSPTSAKKGDNVTIYVNPDYGYKLKKLEIEGASLNEQISYVDGVKKYTFTMPANNVVINYEFEELGNTSPNDQTGTTSSECFVFDKNTKTITNYKDLYTCPKNVIIPSVIDGVTVENIGNNAFANKSLTGVTFPESLKTIGDTAFKNNNIDNVTIPDRVTTIGNSAFENSGLKNLNLGALVETIGDSAFKNNKLTNVVLPDLIETIGDNSFAKNDIDSLTLGENVKTIGIRSFEENDLTRVKIPAGLQEVSYYAFLEQDNGGIVNLYCEGYSADPDIKENSKSELDDSCRLFEVMIHSASGGIVTADRDPAKYSPTNIVSLTVTPDLGYMLADLVLSGANLKEEVNSGTLNYTFEMPRHNVEVFPTFEAIKYKINYGDLDHGSVTGSQDEGIIGDKITITVTPDFGYELQTGSLKVTTSSGDEIPLTQTGDDTYEFDMPASDISVTATFDKINPDTRISSDGCFEYKVMALRIDQEKVDTLCGGIITGCTENVTVEELIIVNYNAKCGQYVYIPGNIDGGDVKEIGEGAFSGKNLTGATIGSGITTIGSGSFTNNNISGVNIWPGLETVGTGSFIGNGGDVNLLCNGFIANPTIIEDSMAVLHESCKAKQPPIDNRGGGGGGGGGGITGGGITTPLNVCTKTVLTETDNGVVTSFVEVPCEDEKLEEEVELNSAEELDNSDVWYDKNGLNCDDVTKWHFTDISTNYARCYIQALAEINVVYGYGDYTYRPDQNITRGEYLALLMRGFNINLQTEVNNTFTDITGEAVWMNKYINKVLEMGVIASEEENNYNFRPNDTISRIEAIKILMNIKDFKVGNDVTSVRFEDTDLNDWMLKYVSELDQLGVLKGVTENGKVVIKPNEKITRAEVAKMVYLLNYEK